MTPEQREEERRRAKLTRALVKAVAMAAQIAPEGEKRDAARQMVPVFAASEDLLEGPEPTVLDLAKAMGVDRSNLWMCLGIYNGEPRHKMRRRLEEFIGLTPGGMTQVLALLEKL